MIIFYISLVLLRSITITLLYEKEVLDSLNNFYNIYLQSLIEKYNQHFLQKQLKVHLNQIIPFNDYINLEKFKEVVNLAGTNDLDGRAMELKKVNDTHPGTHYILATQHIATHYVLGASTFSDTQSVVSFIHPCNSVYVFNLNNSTKELTEILGTVIIDLLSKIFSLELPDLRDNDEQNIIRLEEMLKESEVIKNFKGCGVEEDNPKKEQNEPKSDLEKLVNQLSLQMSNLFEIVNKRPSYNNPYSNNPYSNNTQSNNTQSNNTQNNNTQNKTEKKEEIVKGHLDYGLRKRYS